MSLMIMMIVTMMIIMMMMSVAAAAHSIMYVNTVGLTVRVSPCHTIPLWFIGPWGWFISIDHIIHWRVVE